MRRNTGIISVVVSLALGVAGCGGGSGAVSVVDKIAKERRVTVGTKWDQPDIWLRRTVTLDEAPDGDLYLRIRHDEDAEVYVNGQLAAKRGGHITGYELIPVENGGRSLLRQGENEIAVHCRQTEGEQFIDVGLYSVSEPAPATSAASK